MRIVVIDNDNAFTGDFEQRCKQANVVCLVFPQAGPALAELRKDPNAVDLVICCKEQSDGVDEGLKTAALLRSDIATSEVPYLLTSSSWGKSDFGKHQKTQSGANAYFNKQNSLDELEKLIGAVTGFQWVTLPQDLPKDSGPPVLEVTLEETHEILKASEKPSDSIEFSAPISLFPEGEPPQTSPEKEPLEEKPLETVVAAEEISAEVPMVPLETAAAIKMPPPFVAPQETAAAAEALIEPPTVPPATSPSIEISMQPITIDNITQMPPTPLAESTPPSVSQAIDIKIEAVVTEQAPIVEQISVIEQAVIIEQPAAIVDQPLVTEQPAAIVEVKELVSEQPESEEVSEEQAAQDLPYLFSKFKSIPPPFPKTTATGDLNDVENLKKYLMMREQEVSVLNVQLGYTKDELSKAELNCQQLNLLNEDLCHQMDDLKNKLGMFEQERSQLKQEKDSELESLKDELRSKTDHIRTLEDKFKNSDEQYESLKERVRIDLRKIRVHEKELENKLEILKKDSETLMVSRENKILELKRKIDLLEFNYDTVQNQNMIEKQNVLKIKNKLEKTLKAVRLTQGLIEGDFDEPSSTEQEGDMTLKKAS